MSTRKRKAVRNVLAVRQAKAAADKAAAAAAAIQISKKCGAVLSAPHFFTVIQEFVWPTDLPAERVRRVSGAYSPPD